MFKTSDQINGDMISYFTIQSYLPKQHPITSKDEYFWGPCPKGLLDKFCGVIRLDIYVVCYCGVTFLKFFIFFNFKLFLDFFIY